MAALHPDARTVLPLAALAGAYSCTGVVEFFYYLYRGLSRSDVEASVTMWHRVGTLAACVGVLAKMMRTTTAAGSMLLGERRQGALL
jgi:hypothetical protein